MPLPQPPVPLQDQCTIIYNDKLYAYQANAFQSLDLKVGGQWSQLSMGVSTNGSTCVQGLVDGKAAFIVVGGSGPSDYQGLQHYDLTNNQWKSDTPAVGVAMNRLRHGSAFLQASSEILMYAGAQDGTTNPSTQTFLISTKSPYTVQAFESSAPPVTNPLLLPYNTTHALLLGGDPNNKALYTFGPDQGWQPMDSACLQSGLKNSSLVQAAILDGSDGSKILEIFDLSTTPNQITTVLLSNATSTSSSKKTRSYVASVYHSAKRRKRDTSLANRPPYNSTLAPQDPRVGYSLARDAQSGLIIAAGGNEQNPLAIFNQTGNQWVDPNTFFGDQPSPSATPSSSSSPAASSTYTVPPASSSAVAAANTHVRNKSLTILGAVLGGVFGVALLLVFMLFLLRYYRKRREQQLLQRRSDYQLDNKDEPMDFTDIGADFMKEAGGSTTMLPATAQYQNHSRNRSAQSDRSVDPRTLDRGMTASSESKRALLVHKKGDSAGSGRSFWSRGTKSPENPRSPPQISAPILGPALSTRISAAKPTFLSPNDPRTEPRTDAGWSRYFTNNNSREQLPPGSMRVPQHTQQSVDNRPQTYFSDSQAQSDYTSSRVASSHPHESAEVEPLSFRTSHAPPEISDRGITSPNASRPGLGLAITQGPSPERERDIEPATPTTVAGSVSNLTDEDEDFHHHMAHISHGESSGHDSWDPIGDSSSGQRESNWTDERPFSSAVRSTNSKIYPHPGQRVQIPDFPMPNSARNSAAPSPQVRSPNTEIQNPFDRGLRNVVSKDLASAAGGRQRPTEAPRTGTQRAMASYGQAEARPFPRSKEQMGARGRGGSQTEDMSWLNLGTSAEQGSLNHSLYFPG